MKSSHSCRKRPAARLDKSDLSPLAIASSVPLIATLAIFVRLLVAWKSHFTSEDFLITLRYAENLARGHGMVFNVGEPVLGTTTPLYTLFLAALAWLGLPAALIGKLVNILADAGLCLLRVSSAARHR